MKILMSRFVCYALISILLLHLIYKAHAVRDGELKVTIGSKKGDKNIMEYFVNGEIGLRGSLGDNLRYFKERPNLCSTDGNTYCWGSSVKLEIKQDPHHNSCQIVDWWSTDSSGNLTDCFELDSSGNWYGVGNPVWPLQRTTLINVAAATGGWRDRTSVMERYWITSTGVAIKADDNIPLFLNMGPPSVKNNRRFCFTSRHAEPYRYNPDSPLHLRYTVCHGTDQKDVFLKTRNYFFKKPTGMPDERMIIDPVWSSWARYKVNINTSIILDFAKEIVNEYGFTENSQLEVDDLWETCYGDHDFDKAKFPDPKAMVTELKDMGFRVTLWIHPFINTNCKSHKLASDKGYLVKNPRGESGTGIWWNGNASSVDFTNPQATAWFIGRLERIRNLYGFDTFKFDAGEYQWLPSDYVLHGPASLAPDAYTTHYIRMAAHFGNLTEFRSAHNSHNTSMFVRMQDRDSTWANNTSTGIKSLIPITLQYGVLGYPFVMPDMVGGNSYGTAPNRELYIRWVELNTFLPCIQFSIVPWDFDNEIVNITKKMMAIRHKYKDLLLNTAQEGFENGTPMIRPLWWLDPTDYEAQTIDTEFLLGNDLLVAPILEEGALSRDIFFPKGKWKNNEDGKLYTGPLWVTDYPVPLDGLAYFDKVNE